MKTLTELEQERAARQLDIMERCFSLNERAKQVELSTMSSTATAHLGPEKLRTMRAAESEAWALGERVKLREEFEQSEELFKQQVAAREEEITEALFGPAQNADPTQLMQFVQATEDELITALDVAIRVAEEETIQLVTVVAYERGLTGL